MASRRWYLAAAAGAGHNHVDLVSGWRDHRPPDRLIQVRLSQQERGSTIPRPVCLSFWGGSGIKLAVLASGSGTNLQALIDATRDDPEFGAELCVVISDRPGVKALARAEEADIPAEVVLWSAHGSRDAFSAAVCDAAARHDAVALVLAGFMRILAPNAIARYPHRIINIHPSLLPSFTGAHAVAKALAYGAKLTGVTVHFVDEEVDHGPIIAQAEVAVLADDTETSLHERIQHEEHVLYPRVVKAFAQDRLSVTGRTVVWA